MALQTLSLNKSYGGTEGVYRHASHETQTDMTFSVYVPECRQGTKLAAVWYLSGLTCTHANVTEKGEFRSACAEHGLIFVAPDTSPRGEGVPGDPANSYDFGLGAGFYVDATEAPFAKNYRMWSYVTEELPKLIAVLSVSDFGNPFPSITDTLRKHARTHTHTHIHKNSFPAFGSRKVHSKTEHKNC